MYLDYATLSFFNHFHVFSLYLLAQGGESVAILLRVIFSKTVQKRQYYGTVPCYTGSNVCVPM